MNFLDIDIEEKRKKLLNSVQAKKFTDEIIASADDAIIEEIPPLKMSDYMLFFKTGNRSTFEKKYFKRRNNLSHIMQAFWLTEDEKYLTPLVDYIGYVCDEFTWCIPMHSKLTQFPVQDAIERVDLFQAETTRLFAEIIMCVGEKIPNYIKERMEIEVRRRIFAGFAKGASFWWEKTEMNWATVCAAGCVIAALTFGTDEEQKEYIKRFAPCLDAYLRGIEDDGACKEGPSYWAYGFGNFVLLAQILKINSNGKINYFDDPKVKKLSLYPQKMRMSKTKTAAFSDGIEDFNFKIGLMSFLKSVYDEIELPEIERGTCKGNIDSVIELLWFDENYIAGEDRNETHFFEDSHWYVKKTEKYSFAGKGGNNYEPHNHNDIGSFMITVGEDVFISDLGCGEYTKETLSYDTRFGYIQNGSQGHSVPIINGEYQCLGEEYKAKNVCANDSFFELDIEDAYAKGIINKINRRFEFNESSVKLSDTFEFSPITKTVTERFISKIEPQMGEGFFDLGVGKIKFDAERYESKLSVEQFVAHNAIDTVTVYLMDIVAKNSEKVFEIEFEII